MKKIKRALRILSILLLFAFILPQNNLVFADNEIDISRAAGQRFINSSNMIRMHPVWQNAALDAGQACFNLYDTLIGYLFSITKNSKVVGRIVVANSTYNYRVLEASGAASPAMPEMPELTNAVKRDLAIVATGTPTNLSKLLYLGYYAEYASYEVNGKPVAFDLWRRKAFLISRPTKIAAIPKTNNTTMTSGTILTWINYKILSVPEQQQFNGGMWTGMPDRSYYQTNIAG